ncbi:MAG: PhoH family protein [Rhodospirillales bacterium]|nr:PhoH family protein [Rhodospirillales bacterium]
MTPPTKPDSLQDNAPDSRKLTFENNGLAMQLFGPHQAHLTIIEQKLDVTAQAVGNEVTLIGEADAINAAAEALNGLYGRLKKNMSVDRHEVEAVLRMAAASGSKVADADIEVKTRKRTISPRTPTQAKYLRTIDENELVFGIGPAGTGKTYLAVAKAVERLLRGDVERIILSRPAVEAGEQLGFLPGDMREKVDPYLRPLYDALHDMMSIEEVAKRLETGEIEVAPLAFMRGRTLANAFVILDEAQNTTAVQMKMFLTRLGENAQMVVTGDLTQVDLPRGIRSGLRDASDILSQTKGIGFTRFGQADVVRHHLVSKIVGAYDEAEMRRKAAARYEKGNGAGTDD